ncbi:MAG: biotin carboxylase, partial [Porticoccaceae bacterium]
MTKDRQSKYVAPTVHTIDSPLAAAIISIDVELGQYVEQAQVMAVLESMKMQTALTASFSGTVQSIDMGVGDTVQAGQRLFTLATVASAAKAVAPQIESADKPSDTLQRLNEQLAATQDDQRQEAIARRHAKGFRSARENVRDLCDPESLMEYGQLAVAAQRGRMSQQALESQTPADGVITGLATINSDVFG